MKSAENQEMFKTLRFYKRVPQKVLKTRELLKMLKVSGEIGGNLPPHLRLKNTRFLV